jgi:hypothetical protein
MLQHRFQTLKLLACLVVAIVIFLTVSCQAGDPVPPPKDVDNAAWSVMVRDMQAGLTLQDQHYPYRPGDTLTFNIYLLNAKNESVTLTIQEPAAWTPTIQKERGGPAELAPDNTTDGPLPTERQVTLTPENPKVLVGKVQLKLDATPKDKPAGPHAYLPPGQYYIAWTGRVKEPGQANGFEVTTAGLLTFVAGPEAAEKARGKPPAPVPAEAGKAHSVAVYLAADPMYAGQAEKVPLAAIKLDEQPLLTDADIVVYNWEDHLIQLTPEAFTALGRLYNELVKGRSNRAFVVVADGQRCYLGAFDSMLSSYIPMTPMAHPWTSRAQPAPANAIRIRPPSSYPGGEDTRSDPRLRQALEALGKLRVAAAEAPAKDAKPAAPKDAVTPSP